MNATTAKARSDDRVLELVGAFAESSDARLRGNAIQALVALVNSGESELADRAEAALVQAIVNGPASAEAEWQHRFRSRALDAMEHLDSTKRSRVFEHVRTTYRRSNDVMQRAALASLLLEGNVKRLLLRPANWLELRRLASSLATVGVLRAIWQATWRLVLAALAIFIAILFAPLVLPLGVDLDASKALNQFMSYLPVVVTLLTTLVLVTSVGRLELPIRERLVEAVICGTVFAAISLLGTMIMFIENVVGDWPQSFEDFVTSSGIGLVILGAVIGIAVRLLKWLSNTERTALHRAKLLLALFVVTLAGMTAFQCGMDPKVVGAAWAVLAPAAVAATSLDGWLETIGPNLASLVEKPRSTRASSLVAGFLVVGCLVAIFHTYRNFSRALPSQVASAAEMSGTAIERQTKFPHRLQLNVTKKGTYTIYAAPSDGETNIILTIKRKGRRAIAEDRNLEKNSEEHTNELPEGKFLICVGTEEHSCNYEVDLIDFAAMLVAGDPISRQHAALDLNIRIFPAEQRPNDVPEAPNQRTR